MTELHHKLGFKKFVITSEVIIEVPARAGEVRWSRRVSGVTPDLLAPSTALAAPHPAPAHVEPIDEVHQRFHQVILLELPAGSLHRGWVPFPATQTPYKSFEFYYGEC